MPRLSVSDLDDSKLVEAWTQQLSSALRDVASSRTVYETSVKEDPERHIFYPVISQINHGVRKDYRLDREFFSSADYRSFGDFAEKIADLLGDMGRVIRGDRSESVTDLAGALDWLQKEALRGQSRQRYKGLGEMNPDQLWDTTMDPDKRTMLKVTIEDAIAADLVFNTLMGDQVEPRREFIEENALAVANLDI